MFLSKWNDTCFIRFNMKIKTFQMKFVHCGCRRTDFVGVCVCLCTQALWHWILIIFYICPNFSQHISWTIRTILYSHYISLAQSLLNKMEENEASKKVRDFNSIEFTKMENKVRMFNFKCLCNLCVTKLWKLISTLNFPRWKTRIEIFYYIFWSFFFFH